MRRLSDRDRRFARSQYRRRMQASGIIGVLGAAIGIRAAGAARALADGALRGCFWLGRALAIMLLAAIDAWATRQNYARLRSEQLTAEIRLARELTAARKPSDADESSRQIDDR